MIKKIVNNLRMKGFGDKRKPKKKKGNIFNNLCTEKIINQAIKFQLEGNISEALKYYQYLINLGIRNEVVFNYYGIILITLGRLQEAELSFRRAIEIKPDFVEAYNNLGGILKDLGKLKEAELSFRRAIEIKPDFADAFFNIGVILKDLGQLKEAEKLYRKAIEIKPDFANAFFNLSSLELLQGKYKFGLENYEFRFLKKKPAIIHGKTNLKRINYKEIKNKEKLLVISEQGLGDTLQFMRYIPYLRNQGFKVSFCVQEKLHSLIQASGIDQNPLKPEQSETISEGRWSPLLSLPKYLQVEPNNPLISEPYIFATKELKKKWKNILSIEKRPIIGINWQGNPNIEKGGLRGRSLPLETFSTLAKNNKFKLLSLQKGFGSEQLEKCSFKSEFIECQAKIDDTWDLLDYAAIIENCDLIITSDTYIAHLAGGMGKTTWLLLHYLSDWRWGMEPETTFWYPSMKLFRQKQRNDWQEPMERISNILTKERIKA